MFTDSVVAFIDILGFKQLIESEEDCIKLFEIIKSLKENNTKSDSVQTRVVDDNREIITKPTITSFSDCVVFSISLKNIPENCNKIDIALICLLHFIEQLADVLMTGGYVIRGGVARGDLYHHDGVVFGKSLIEAYDLESNKAKTPRVLISDALIADCELIGTWREIWKYLSKDSINSSKSEYYLDYLKFSFCVEEVREKYKNNTERTIEKIKNDILKEINAKNINQNRLSNSIKILEKWACFKSYVDKALENYDTLLSINKDNLLS